MTDTADTAILPRGTEVSEDSPRSDVYALLSSAYSFPDATVYADAKDGHLAEHLAGALGQLPYRLRTSDLSWKLPDTYDEMQSEYIRLFQIGGRRGPPCPLHAGHYDRDRSHTLQNLIRFYNYFGFRVMEGVMPDQLAVQLEFMSELAAGGIAERASSQRAQRDFLQNHLGWTETLWGRVAKAGPHPFYRSLTALTARLIVADQRFIQSVLGGSNDGES
jgi:DMSO reductase family type II enzyme chaperone